VGAQVRVSVLCPGWVNTRIADAERNRPAAFQPATPPRPRTEAEQAMEQLGRQMLAAGVAPDRVAEHVLAAVHEERFYVLTHPEFDAAIQTRMENVLARRNPTLLPLDAGGAEALGFTQRTTGGRPPSSR
jgi:short-subunit dehydrogenase